MKQLAHICDLPEDTPFQKLASEMEKRFYNAILLADFGEDSGPILVRYTGITGGEFHFRCEGTNKKYSILLEDDTTTVSIPDFPCGYYSRDTVVGPQLFYFNREPYRQWKRGLSADNASLWTNAHIVTGNILISNMITTCYPVLMSRKRNSLKEACACASIYGESIVNLDFVVTANPMEDNDTLLLWYHGCVVGTIKDNKILVENEIFLQEVKDTFTNTEFSIGVYDGE